MAGILKIVVSGPESSGKSALVKDLAQHFKLPFVEEYARLYLEREGPSYDYELVSRLAREHWEFQQEQILEAEEMILLDTDLISYVIWQKVVFNKVDPWILKKLKSESDHRYLLCYPDLPWEDDPLRENRDNRNELFELYQQAITENHRPFEVVSGLNQARNDKARELFLQLTGS